MSVSAHVGAGEEADLVGLCVPKRLTVKGMSGKSGGTSGEDN